MSARKKRNFQFEALKHGVMFDQEYAEKTWKFLEHAIHGIYNHNLSCPSFEELYKNAYNMVRHKYGEKLYSGLVTAVTYQLKEMSKSIEAAQGELFLKELNRNWAEHNKAVLMIRDIFGYMDWTFIPSTHKTPIHELGLILWRDVVIDANKTRSRLLDTLLELVRRERSEEVINRGLMRNIIKMLMDLGSTVYEDDFEKHFLEVSADFYRCESQEFVKSCDCGNYLKKAERRLTEEMERVSHYLDARSEAKITNVVEKEMIESHMNRLVHMESSGLVNMLVDDKYDDLGRMYRLFRRVQNGLVIVRDVMTVYIQDTGMQLVTDPERLKDPLDFVQRLLDLKDKYDKVISLAFNNDETFQNALHSSFEYVINLNARSPEFIRLFVDDKLRKGLRGVSEEDVEVVLDKVMMLFRYLQENDKEMIEGHMNRIVHMESSGFVNMLTDGKYDDLGRMYRLFRRVRNGLAIVQDVTTAYIRDTGMQLVTDPERLRDPVDFVQRLLDLKDKYDKVISSAFNNDETFQNALNSSFEYVINLNARSLEFICLFVDDKLRKALRGVSEEDVEVVLDKVMMLFRYLQENDKEMIEGHMNRIVHMESSGLVNMLMDGKYDDLGRLYRLFCRVRNGLVIVQDVTTAYIRDTGMQLVTDPERLRDPVDFVQCLLDLKDKYDKVISLAFNNDETFQNALNSSFEYVINLNARSLEFICLFVDDKLRKALRGVSEEDVEVVLDKVMMLFPYLQENDKEMIEDHMNRIVHMESSGLVNMLMDGKYDDLGRMYRLFRRVRNGLVIVQDVMTAYIRDTGMQLVTEPERLRDPVDFVQRLLDLKDKYDKFISLAFNNDKTFQNALNSSFEYFINLDSRSPEFISLFVDDKLRKGLRGVREEDVEVVLDKVMMIFHYLQEKDVFEKYYRQHLAKRLLSGKTSDDAERSLFAKLKTECGYQFTCKLEGMFTDMKISEDMMRGFYSTFGPLLGDNPTLTVQVLTTGSWPTQPSTTCNLPAEIFWLCEKFKSYYLGTHTGRRLSWQTNMGTADLKSTFGKGQKHELNVSTYQMCVLMLFNDADRLTYKEIEQATEIPAFDLKRCLQSLACVKGKNVLRKEPMNKDIAEEDAFFFNDKFTSKFFKVKIGTVFVQRESEPEYLETRQRVEQARKAQIEAQIVRIMKSRRVLDHKNIVAEVTKQLQGRFLPNPVVVKKLIESLVEREYLERDETDGKLYRYLA